MKSDTLKTLAGLVIIALIVVATFFYGNAQRQAQIKKTQLAAASPEASAKPAASLTPTPSVKPSVTPAPTPVVQDGLVHGAAGAMPAAGPEAMPILAVASMAAVFALWRRSRLTPASQRSSR